MTTAIEYALMAGASYGNPPFDAWASKPIGHILGIGAFLPQNHQVTT